MKNKILSLWEQNKPCINAWLSIPNSFTAEAFSKMPWDSVTIDMQHGQNDYSSSVSMIQAICINNPNPIVRVPWNEPGIIMKMLDLGTTGIIAPMINSKRECEDFVSYCYYPPIGQRSFGPMRAQMFFGENYFEKANDNIISLAMIETKQAVENLEEILSVPNLTGIYIGPADMSTSYGLKPKFDIKEDPVFSNIKMIATKTKEYNKIAGIHTGSVNYAKEMIDLGFKFISVSSDFRIMSTYANNIIEEIKDKNKSKSSNSAY